jgi:hypothetical protein
MLSVRDIFVWFSFGDWMVMAVATIAQAVVPWGASRPRALGETLLTILMAILTALFSGGIYSVWFAFRRRQRVFRGSFVVPLASGLVKMPASLAVIWMLGGDCDLIVVLSLPVLLAGLSLLAIKGR